MKVSYPFLKADRIHTPTLFMGGDKDFNVPLLGGEQMYQALQSLGVPTELVIYPGDSTASPDLVLFAIAMSAISPGMTSTSSCLPRQRSGPAGIHRSPLTVPIGFFAAIKF